MAFGLSFGAKKNKVDTTTNVDKTENTNQQQTGTKTQSGTTAGSSTQQQTGSTVGQQTTSQTGTNKTIGTQTGVTSQTTTAFSDPVLQGIERVVGDLFGRVGGRPTLSNFNAEEFVAGGSAAANADIQAGLESNVNQLITNTGGAEGSNSMTALLANRLRGDAAAERAGIRANLVGQAEGIVRDNALAANQIAATDQGFLGNLLAALKGGQVTTTGSESVTSAQDQQTQTTGTTNTAEQQAQQTSAQQVQTQQLVEALSQLLQGSTNTVGTERTKGKTTEMGGGFSLGF